MFIDQILYPVKTLGPGKRIAIWTVGCHRMCPGCSNPELWDNSKFTSIAIDSILNTIEFLCRNNDVDGITITGGEPLEQSDLIELLQGLSQINNDILLYTGYKYEDILNDSKKNQVLNYIGVLIDGDYQQEYNTQLVLRGSKNQRILLFDPDLECVYRDYLSQKSSKIQNFYFHEGHSVSVGIHNKSYQEDLRKKLMKFGIHEKEEVGE